ncbi:Uncharacterised protein [Enterobacter hormaechei]|nr:Uncharacterised protein [Enterobacter hormaechei]
MRFSGSPISRSCAKSPRAWPRNRTCAPPIFRRRRRWRTVLIRSGQGSCLTVAAVTATNVSTSISVIRRLPGACYAGTASGGRLSPLRTRSPVAAPCLTSTSSDRKTARMTSVTCLCASSSTIRRRYSRSRSSSVAWSMRWKNGRTSSRLPTVRLTGARYGLATTRHTPATAQAVRYWLRHL